MRLRSASASRRPIWRATSATGKLPAAAPDQWSTSLSPCSPSTRIDVCWADAQMCREQRAEPRRVQDGAGPDHSFDGTPRRPAIAVTISVITSTGLVATRKIGSGAVANTAGTISAKSSALRDSKSSRFSPGLWLVPAASTTRRAPSRSANSPARTRTGSAKRSVQNVARLRDRQIRVAIDEQDPRTDTAHHHGISRGGADLSGSDDADFHAVPPYRSRSRYPRPLPDGQPALSADAPAPHRLRQLSAAASSSRRGRTLSGGKKKTDPECGFGAPGTKTERGRYCPALPSERRTAIPLPSRRTPRGDRRSRRRPALALSCFRYS